jgi:hypothetical protein
MIRKRIERLGEWVEYRLRCLCGRISPDVRVWVIVAMFLVFSALSLWFTISSIYRFGKGNGERMRIEHIERLELELRQKDAQLDSVKHFNNFYYDRETRESE